MVVLACFAVYQGGLSGDFTNWDDNWLITENRHIRALSWQNLQAMFNPLAPREELGNEYLPIRDLSYAVNYALDGYHARGYHAFNLVLHILNSLLVLLLGYRLTGNRWLGGVAGLLFAVHPVHVEAVSWLSSRKDLLSAFFLLAATHLYLACRRRRDGLASSESFVRRVGENRRLAYGLSLLCFVLALLSKMPAVVLPALLVLLELFRGRELATVGTARRAALLAPFWGIALLFTLLAMKIGTGLMREPYGDGLAASTLTAAGSLARGAQVLVLGWPTYAAVDMPVEGVGAPALLGMAVGLALLVLGVLGWRRREWDTPGGLALGLGGFSALWFLCALAPVSNFVVQIGTVYADRYLYIPSIAFCLGLAGCAAAAAARLGRSPARFAVPAVLALTLGAWVVLTAQAVLPWRGSLSLWTGVLAHDPGNHTAHFNLAREHQERALLESDDAARSELLALAMAGYQAALDHPARTFRHDPARVRAAMASVEVYRDRPAEALVLLEQAAAELEQPWRRLDKPEHLERVRDMRAILANYRGLALSALGRDEEAAAAFGECVANSARYGGARLNLAALLARKALAGSVVDEGMFNKALAELNQYERDRGPDALLLRERARIRYAEFSRRLELSGQGGSAKVPEALAPLLDESRALYRQVLELERQGAARPKALARLYVEAAEVMARGRAGDAEAEKLFRRALEQDPGYVGLRTMLALLLFERGGRDKVEANRLLQEELTLHPTHKPALQLRAAGLRQTAVDQAAALRAKWGEDFGQPNPTWPGLIVKFAGREEFRRGVLLVVQLLQEAVAADPGNDEIYGLIEGTGLDLARGLWFTRDDSLRARAEELLRTAFNARPEDGPVAQVLTRMYLELAERAASGQWDSEEARREAVAGLLANMLALSEKARLLLSSKLYRVGLDVESGKTQVADAEGNPRELSEYARRMTAAEFIRWATVVNPENIEALDWLKHFYEGEGDLGEAVKVFQQLVEALKDRPQLMHGVYLSLAQLQLDLGQQMLKAFNNKVKQGQEEEARQLRDKAVSAYLDALDTTGRLLENPENPDKISQPIRMRGVAAQRLAYLLTADAEKYYTLALQAYAQAPLDFEAEIAEVRKKRAWFIRDPYRKLAELRQTLEDLPADADRSGIEQDIRDVERRITRIEAEAALREGKPERALAILQPAMAAPTPGLFAVRGDAHAALAAAATNSDAASREMVAAAQDWARAVTEPDALLKAADAYWAHEALIFDPRRVTEARMALNRAAAILDDTLDTIAPDDENRPWLEKLRNKADTLDGEMKKLAAGRRAAARRLAADARYEEALGYAHEGLDMLGNDAAGWQQVAQIQRDWSRSLRPTDAARADGLATEARGAFEAALSAGYLLPSQRLTLQLDLCEVLLRDLKLVAEARDWLTRAEGTLNTAGDDVRALIAPRLEALRKEAGR